MTTTLTSQEQELCTSGLLFGVFVWRPLGDYDMKLRTGTFLGRLEDTMTNCSFLLFDTSTNSQLSAGARYTKWIASLEWRHKEHNNDP